MKKKKMLTVALALLLPVCAGIGSAHAYFTDHVAAAGGGYEMEIGSPNTELTEDFDFGSWTKRVYVKNTGKIPVYVRVKAFCGEEYHLEFKGNDTWEAGSDGYYYYIGNSGSGVGVLEVDEETPSNLGIEIRLNQKGENGEYLAIPAPPDENREKFNVVVVCERTPLQYDENGTLKAPAEANWTLYKPEAWSEKEGGEGE